MKIQEHDRGFRDGVRYAITWLHERAREMNDPWAKTMLNTAAFNLGEESKSAAIDAKAKLLEIAIARATEQAGLSPAAD